MKDLKLAESEYRFMKIVWENQPLTSASLVKLCAEKLEWKKSTTYTVLKKLCDRGIFQNVDGVVTAVLSKQEFAAAQSEQFVEETFGGSLPAFIAAFASSKQLSVDEIKEIRKMMDSFEEE